LLVQPVFAGLAAEEVSRIASETGTPAESFRILEGDITQTDLGLSAKDVDIATSETTVLFHLAAIYDLTVQRDLAMQVNVEGTRNVNHFALNRLTMLRRYHYVSTCYVAGRRKGLISEAELQHDAGFRNYYEETKYLAEIEVEEMKSKLPITIHRPSVVCGDSRTGETAKYDGIYYLIHYLRMQPRLLSIFNIGNKDVSLNLTPVDFVVEAMTALTIDDKAIGETVQLADPSPLATKELFDIIAETIGGHASRITIPAPLVFKSLMLPFSPKMTGLPRSAVPYFFLEQTYDTARARELLEPHGVRCPTFPTYVDKLVSFVASHPKL
jgi:thioester reductase-like protein